MRRLHRRALRRLPPLQVHLQLVPLGDEPPDHQGHVSLAKP